MKIKKYLLIWTGMFADYRRLATVKELTETEKGLLKEGKAKLFTTTPDREMVEVYMNGRVIK